MKKIIMVLFISVFVKADECPFIGVYRADQYNTGGDAYQSRMIPYLKVDSLCNYDSQFISTKALSATQIREVGEFRKKDNEYVIVPIKCGINLGSKCNNNEEYKIKKNEKGVKFGGVQYYSIDEARVDSVNTIIRLGPKNAHTESMITKLFLFVAGVAMVLAIAFSD